VELVYVEAAESRSAAARREAALKRLDRGEKLALADATSWERLQPRIPDLVRG